MARRKRLQLVRRLCFLSVGIVVVGLSAITSASGSGQWVPPESSGCPSSGSSGCPQSTTCGEWEVDGQAVTSCCISPSAMGSNDPNACSSP